MSDVQERTVKNETTDVRFLREVTDYGRTTWLHATDFLRSSSYLSIFSVFYNTRRVISVFARYMYFTV